MYLHPTNSSRNDTLLPYTALFRCPSRTARGPRVGDGRLLQHRRYFAARLGAQSDRLLRSARDCRIRPLSSCASVAQPRPRASGGAARAGSDGGLRSEEHTSELQSLMRISYAVFCLKKKNNETEKLMRESNTTTNSVCNT